MSRIESEMAVTTSKSRETNVILHQFRPNGRVVNASPPCLKLETFLRMARIPFDKDLRLVMSRKGKMPWIEYKGLAVADSYFCILFLSKEFNVDLDERLSAMEKATAHCIQAMLEEKTYW